jgi:thousand and one amino acid protein kinase
LEQALVYIHNGGKIHRDIKAANILLTPNGRVKLADFGSATMKSPANSLSGTPYWMAPELIMAMEDGTYTSSVDLWSLGITVIELATMTPPLFQMNAMSALYHIPQKDPARLEGEKWSSGIKDFVGRCLQKDPDARPSASELLTDVFTTQDLPPTTLLQLVKNATNPEVIDSNRKQLAEALEATRETLRTTSLPKLRHELPAMQEDDEGDASSSGGSDGVGGGSSSAPSSTSSSPKPARSSKMLLTPETTRKKKKLTSPLGGGIRRIVWEQGTLPSASGSAAWSSPRLDRAKSKRNKPTLGPLAAVRSNRKENNQKAALENEMIVFQLKQMKKIRKSHTKMLEALDAKHAPELTQLLNKGPKELESLAKVQEREREKLSSRCKSETALWDKEHATELRKVTKQLKLSREKEVSKAAKAAIESLKVALQTHKRETTHKSKGERKFLERELREYHADGCRRSDRELMRRLDADETTTESRFRTTQLESRQKLELLQLRAVSNTAGPHFPPSSPSCSLARRIWSKYFPIFDSALRMKCLLDFSDSCGSRVRPHELIMVCCMWLFLTFSCLHVLRLSSCVFFFLQISVAGGNIVPRPE